MQTNIVRFDVGGMGHTTGVIRRGAAAKRGQGHRRGWAERRAHGRASADRRRLGDAGARGDHGARARLGSRRRRRRAASRSTGKLTRSSHSADDRSARVTAGLARLVLASASPRRQALIGLLGLAWRVAPAAIDEERYLLDDPLVSALNVALAKARAIEAHADEVVVAADTIVALDGDGAGQAGRRGRGARDAARAARAWARRADGRGAAPWRRSGRTGAEWGGVVSTRVVMRDYGDEEIEAYVARGEPFDKAGGYAVQDELFGTGGARATGAI